jgi:hypothetical protein
VKPTKLPPEEVLRGGCPCGFWALPNCRYAQAVAACRTPLADRPARKVAAGGA